MAVDEVYRKNSQIDTKYFQNEYWLGKQGAKFGREQRTAFIYHTPELSSMQLKTVNNQLILNLDNIHDHRYRRDSFGLCFDKYDLRAFHEHNAAEFAAGEKRINKYSLVIGISPKAIPRLMISPGGYLGTMIWTEHADRSTIKSHKAVYYGREDIQSPSDAVGGFVKYKVPVTKSIFYANPAHRAYNDSLIPNRDGNQDLKSYLQVAVKDNPEFLKFLKDLSALGYDIGIHGLGPSSSDEKKELLEEAIAYMKDQFKAVTWIDHGRHSTNISTNGLDASAPQYARNLWKKYQTKFFWHYSTEDISHTHDRNIDLLQVNKGDHLHTPLYWLHPTMTYGFYSWAAIATSILDLYNEESLNQLINQWSISINHVYPAWVYQEPSRSEFYYQDSHGKLIVHPKFDALLAIMSRLRDEGKLNLTTIRDIMFYWIKLKNIRFEYQDQSNILIYNNNDQKINGLSFAVNNSKINNIYVNGKKPFSKIIATDTIFWINIKPMSKVKIFFD